MTRVLRFFLFVCALCLVFGLGLRQGVIPTRFNPLAPVVLSEPDSWFLDWRLSALKHDANLCRSVLHAPTIQSVPVPDQPIKAGCGWSNAVHMTEAGGARLSLNPLTCEMAAALAMWVEHAVQPAAIAAFGQRIQAMHALGTYACRNIIGNPVSRAFRSQHARANAVDIASFTVQDGTVISVLKNWNGDGPAAQFLHKVHLDSCRYFRVSLSPDFNIAHQDHLHLDRGLLRSCR